MRRISYSIPVAAEKIIQFLYRQGTLFVRNVDIISDLDLHT